MRLNELRERKPVVEGPGFGEKVGHLKQRTARGAHEVLTWLGLPDNSAYIWGLRDVKYQYDSRRNVERADAFKGT